MRPLLLPVVALLCLLLGGAACNDPAPLEPACTTSCTPGQTRTAATIRVEPETLTVPQGAPAQDLTVTVTDSSGAAVASQPVTWASSDTAVASVSPASSTTDASGRASTRIAFGAAAGRTATITASAGAAAARATVTVTSPAPAGRVLFTGDFETGDLSQLAAVQQCRPGRITVYTGASKPYPTAPDPRRGRYAAAFHVLNSDIAPCTPTENPRAQAYTSESLFRPGDEVWEAWSVFVPGDFPLVQCPSGGCAEVDGSTHGSWFILQQDYGPPYHSVAPTEFKIAAYNGVNHFELNGLIGLQWHAPVPVGRWNDFLVHKRFATDATGWIEVWFNGQPIVFKNGSTRLTGIATLLPGATGAAFKLAQYRQYGMFDQATLYFDEARVGTTRSAVEIPSGASADLIALGR